jgi:hypothetical protein
MLAIEAGWYRSKPSTTEIAVDHKGNAVECKWDTSENAIIKEKTVSMQCSEHR